MTLIGLSLFISFIKEETLIINSIVIQNSRPENIVSLGLGEVVSNIEPESSSVEQVSDDSIFESKGKGIALIIEKEGAALQVQNEITRENGVFFSLVRNSDLYGILRSIRQVEDRFNKRYHYDWVFANDKPFTLDFKKIVSKFVSGRSIFVELTDEFWSIPEWIDKDRAKEVRKEMARQKIKYGNSESYRLMCRFNSGLFYKLPALQDYRYYWRIEPDIEYHCDIDYDPFKMMREENKIYGFTLAPLELHTTVETLWDTVKNYTQIFPQKLAPNNNFLFLTDDEGENFNMCHFWSNFEIGDLEFFRSETYNHFFDYLDQIGGIFYERWGDAPIHTIAVSLLLPKDQLHFFQNTGYFHNPNGDCPRNFDIRMEKNCDCNHKFDTTWGINSCITKYFDVNGYER
ncbi:hypothetical protein PACTADRAFT_38092, partial [Pachysolen tannophilus NRRL Y-2460]